MRILALETAEITGSVAALDDGRLLIETPLDPALRSAQSLAPAIQRLLEKVGWQPGDVELIAVTSGPGSFTSLRIGVTTAKAFAYAAGCQILGVNTLEVIASRVPPGVPRFDVVLDAQREQVFLGRFTRSADGPTWLETTTVKANDAWLAGLAVGDVVTGTALNKLSSKLSSNLPAGITALAPQLWAPTAEATGVLAWRHFRAGRRDDVFTLLPQYFRRTAAEEQWEKRGGRTG